MQLNISVSSAKTAPNADEIKGAYVGLAMLPAHTKRRVSAIRDLVKAIKIEALQDAANRVDTNYLVKNKTIAASVKAFTADMKQLVSYLGSAFKKDVGDDILSDLRDAVDNKAYVGLKDRLKKAAHKPRPPITKRHQ